MCMSKERKEWRNNNREKSRSYTRDYFEQNKKVFSEKKIRRDTNPTCRMFHSLTKLNLKSAKR